MEIGNEITLDGRFRVSVGTPLRHLSRPEGEAVAAVDTRGVQGVFAILLKPEVSVRWAVLKELIRRPVKGLRCPVAASTVRLDNGQHRYCIVFNHVDAHPVLVNSESGILTESALTTVVMPGVIRVVLEMNERQIAHRNIRPDTVLNDGAGDVILDQCVIGYAGEFQPPVYETSNALMTNRGGRGERGFGADVYALGVTAFAMSVGERPCEGMDENQMMWERAYKGSYDVLLQRRKLGTGIQTLLAGALQDNAKQRWGVDQLKRWAGGSWDPPKPGGGAYRTPRAIRFNGEDHFYPSLLAWEFHRNPGPAMELITGGRLENWIRSSMANERIAEIVSGAIELLRRSPDGKTAQAECLARVVMAIDPLGPIRFRNLVFAPGGMGPALSAAFAGNENQRVQDFATLFGSSLLEEWAVAGGPEFRTALPPYVATQMQSNMKQALRKGHGIERCLYDLQPGNPCLSPRIQQCIACTPEELVLAMEYVVDRNADDLLAQDRHIAAFLAMQNRRLERRVANDLSSVSEEEGPDRYSVAAFIANLQTLYYPAPLPNLGSAIARYLKPLTGDIRSTLRRSVVEQSLDAMATSGDLQPLSGALDMRQILALDMQEYEQAIVEYRRLNEYITHFGVDAPRNRALAIKRGFEVARLASLSVAFMTFFYFAMVAML